jgi:hypothetical protein
MCKCILLPVGNKWMTRLGRQKYRRPNFIRQVPQKQVIFAAREIKIELIEFMEIPTYVKFYLREFPRNATVR